MTTWCLQILGGMSGMDNYHHRRTVTHGNSGDGRRNHGSNQSAQSNNWTSLKEQLKQSEELVKFLNDTIQERNKDNGSLLSKYEGLNNRSTELTKQLADTLESKGDMEDTSDEFSNMKLSKRFMSILNDKWVPLLEYFVVDEEGKDELTVIDHLSKLLQECYDLCVQQADSQIRGFLLLGEGDEVPDNDTVSDTYKCRRINGQTKAQRSKIKQIVMEKMRESKSKDLDEKPKQELQTKLDEFFEDYIDCCWLMTISKPRLILQFNVINKVHAGQLLKSFKKYATEEAVKVAGYCKGTILHVVWPSVCLHNAETVLYTKGEVITVDEDKEPDEANDI